MDGALDLSIIFRRPWKGEGHRALTHPTVIVSRMIASCSTFLRIFWKAQGLGEMSYGMPRWPELEWREDTHPSFQKRLHHKSSLAYFYPVKIPTRSMEEAYVLIKDNNSSYFQWPYHIKVSYNLYDNHLAMGLLTTLYTGEARGSLKVANQGSQLVGILHLSSIPLQTDLRASHSQSIAGGGMDLGVRS